MVDVVARAGGAVVVPLQNSAAQDNQHRTDIRPKSGAAATQLIAQVAVAYVQSKAIDDRAGS